jgi:hypothetical protein
MDPQNVSILWRVGSKIPLNVYEGDRPVCQCHSEGRCAANCCGHER